MDAAAAGGRRLPKMVPASDVAKFHVQIMLSEVLPGVPKAKHAAGAIREAGRFLAASLVPMEKIDGSAKEATRVRQAIASMTKSAGIVHRFARALRPAALYDLGLILALHSFLN